ncbi:MAG: zinc metalloprotease HtpX [Pseudomonadota bacterium]
MTNFLKTFMLMAALTALFMVAGQAIGGRAGLKFAFGMALFMNFVAYWFSDSIALRMSGAQEVSQSEASELHQIVQELSMKAGIPKPRVYVVPSDTPNAFATGRNPEHAAVAVTKGIMSILNRRELEGVLAHELAHIRNRDILVSSIAAVFAGAISHLATMAQWSMFFGGGRDDEEGGGNMIGSILMMILAPIAALLIQMAISRSREYMADRSGAQIVGEPLPLANALVKLEEWNHRLPMHVNPAQAQMYIVNPLTAQSFAKLFSTHPPIKERVARLQQMA